MSRLRVTNASSTFTTLSQSTCFVLIFIVLA